MTMVSSGCLWGTQLSDQRAKLAEGAGDHFLQAGEQFGNLPGIALQEQAGGMGGKGKAEDLLADRIVQPASQAVAFARRSQLFSLGCIFLQLLVSPLQFGQQYLAFGLVRLRLYVQDIVRNQKEEARKVGEAEHDARHQA